jgi:hypothetical protein
MEQIGGVCASLARIDSTVLANGNLHIFPDSIGQKYKFGAFGGGYGPQAFIGLSDYWTHRAANPTHLTQEGPQGSVHRDLQQLLAHEADHIYTADTSHADPLGYTTVHSEQCRGY